MLQEGYMVEKKGHWTWSQQIDYISHCVTNCMTFHFDLTSYLKKIKAK